MSIYQRGKIWHFDFAIKGKRFRGSTLTSDKTAAHRIVAKLRLEAAESIHFPVTPEMSLAEALLKYSKEHSQFLPSAYTIDRQIEKLRAIGDNTLLSEITDATIATYVAKRRTDKARNKETATAPATVNREITMLRAILNHAATKWAVAVGKVRWTSHKLPERERVRYLSADEEARLLGALRPDFQPLVRFCLATGARLASACALTWADVDEATGSIVFRVFKGGGTHLVPITGEVRSILASERGNHPIYVFTYQAADDRPQGVKGVKRIKGERYPFSANGWRRPWARALQLAGIKDFRFHDLRHTAGSRITRAGGIAVAQQLLGHADITTTKRYAHVLMDDVRQAMEKVARHESHHMLFAKKAKAQGEQ
jgi:integrase